MEIIKSILRMICFLITISLFFYLITLSFWFIILAPIFAIILALLVNPID
jgi:hypothetical protein